MMKSVFVFLTVFNIGNLVFAQGQVPFNKGRCQAVMPAGFSGLCDVHEEQFSSRSFRVDMISGYTYTSCNKFTGELSRHSVNAVPCVSYFVESELKKEIVLKSIFGLTPKYPLNYKGLLINFSHYQPQVQYGHGTSIPAQAGYPSSNRQMTDSSSIRQLGDSATTRQYGHSPGNRNFQMGDNQGSPRGQQMQ